MATTTMRSGLLLVQLVVLAIGAGYSLPAEAAMAEAKTSWFIDEVDTDKAGGTYSPVGASWELGQISAQCGGDPQIPPNESDVYKLGSFSIAPPAKAFKDSCFAEAKAQINIPKETGKGQFEWDLVLSAESRRDTPSDDPTAIAKSKGDDPQFFDAPGSFGGEVGLLAGSYVFESEPGGRTDANSSFFGFGINVPGLSDSLYLIELEIEISGLVPNVVFSNDSRVEFFDPVTLFPVTESDVETALLAQSAQLTSLGLLSDLSLFGFAIDLSGESFASGEVGIGATGVANAIVTPEPSTALLLGLGLIGLAARRRVV